MKNKAIILVNTGTPEKPEKKYVRRFLSEFLNDPRVIDMPWILRKILVNMIIIPFRVSHSTMLYRQLWTDEGSPLLINLNNLVMKLRGSLDDKWLVAGAMRYGNPSLPDILNQLKEKKVDEIIIFPLFPHYASSTTGSINELVMKNLQSWNTMPKLKFINQFYSHESFLSSWEKQIRKYNPEKYDHVLFSYHGLPLSHVQKSHPDYDYTECKCEESLPAHGTMCYKAVCYETSRLLAEKLNLDTDRYSTSFQSRLAKKWITPFTDVTIRNLANEGKRSILVVAPSFVADCLETIVEIGDDCSKIFRNAGGERLDLVESLNYNEDWVEAIQEIAQLKNG